MGDMEKIRVLVVDDEPVYREGLSRILEEEEALEVVGKSSNYEEALKLVEKLSPDVVVIGVKIAEPDNLEVISKIRAASPNTAILAVSSTASGTLLLSCLQAGVAGFLLKKTELHEIVNAVRSLYMGEVVLEKNGVNKMLEEIQRGEQAGKILLLKDREVEVLKEVARGASNKDIAQELSISVRTVQTHLANIFAKLGVDTRTEAVLYAVREGWISLDEVKPPAEEEGAA
jgi:NarL family two-component system response regulator LiaR